ncbi:hypothetical protein F4778DRAFT_215033 [Xylariomycetidae sp. FL2044]|nr:hypothetical protein F4778DRAFT_215033 [Xylariomycetidae sp. FL2044]
MEHTFITIHNLSPDANILFASHSVYDILGYLPQDVQGRSCFDFFHPEEVPFARSIHNRGILLDKAAVLHYARILSRDGQWTSCECCFTIVHDVLVACTSIYRRGEKSERRAMEAPQIRRIFSSSPRDPRYHMLEHLSPKFKMPPMEREPRAALILNRFTRNLRVMFATNAVSSILGVSPDQIQGKRFYDCIAENCLQDALNCLESAKANDSIAYLRFWYRDPRREEDFEDDDDDEDDEDSSDEYDEAMDSGVSSDSDGGVQLGSAMDVDADEMAGPRIKIEASMSPGPSKAEMRESVGHAAASSSSSNAAHSSGGSQIYAMPVPGEQRRRARSAEERAEARAEARRRRRQPIPSFELEAVVSCTSDGLVVVLRKARPPIPALHPPLLPVDFENGLFAAPWSEQPIRPYYPPEVFSTFQPPLLPQYMPLRDHIKAAGGPPLDQLMKSIRDVAVFAWALVGINGNIASYSHGKPSGIEAQPPDGLPIWDPNAPKTSYLGPEPRRSTPMSWDNIQDKNVGMKPDVFAALHGPSSTNEGPQTSSSSSTGSNNYTNLPAWQRSGSYQAQASWMLHPREQHPQHPTQSSSSSSSGYQAAFTPAEPWTDAAAAYAHETSNSQAIPTCQAQSYEDTPPTTYRHMWQ